MSVYRGVQNRHTYMAQVFQSTITLPVLFYSVGYSMLGCVKSNEF